MSTPARSWRRAHGSGLIRALEISPDGRRLYAVQGRRLRVLQASTLRLLGSVDLHGHGRAIALRHDGRAAAVVLTGGRVAIVEPRKRRLLRRVRVPGATGVVIERDRTLVSARGRIRVIARGERRMRGRAIALPRGAGGNLALSPGRTRLAVGARAGGSGGALVFLRSDRARGGDGEDFVTGDTGDDEIVETGFGNDRLLSGGPGDDVIRGGRGSDRRMLGDDGNDELSASRAPSR